MNRKMGNRLLRIRPGLLQNEILRSVFSSATAKFGVVIFGILILVAAFAPFISPGDPNLQNLFARLFPPGSVVKGTTYVLGTDNFGRDVLSRVIWGTRTSLILGLSVVLFSSAIGIAAGLVAGYFGGCIDGVIMRVVDIMLAFPLIIIAIALVGALGGSIWNLIITLSLVLWTTTARVVRAETLKIKESDYVTVLRVIGASRVRILFGEILPNLLSPIFVIATSQLAITILIEAALSFLGLGVPPSIPSWGEMLNEGRVFIYSAWWLATFPGIAIFGTVFSINLMGDALRDTMDPRLRR